MDNNGNITESTDGSDIVNVGEKRSEAMEDRALGCQIWKHCCRFHLKEMEFAFANLHYALQRTNRERWLEITRLRSMELNQNKRGLVLKFITWMAKLDRRLAEEGIFVESETKKYMEHPVLGYIPEFDYESVITKWG